MTELFAALAFEISYRMQGTVLADYSRTDFQLDLFAFAEIELSLDRAATPTDCVRALCGQVT